MPLRTFFESARKFSPRSFLQHQVLFHGARFGASKGITAAIAKFATTRVAVSVGLTATTGLIGKSQLDKAKQQGLEREVLAQGSDLDWLNAVFESLWPHLDKGIRHFIRNEIEPALEKQVGPILGGYLRFENVTLGEHAPKLGPVDVTKTADGVACSIGLDFTCAGHVDFTGLHIADLRIKGTFQVVLGPLVDALNPVGGITISCLDRPVIDLKLQAGADLYAILRATVDNVVAKQIVVPNGIAVPLDTAGGPVTDFAELRSVEPKGFLRLTLQELHFPGSTLPAPKVQVRVGAAAWDSQEATISQLPEDPSPSASAGMQSDDPEVSDIRMSWPEGQTQDFAVFSPNQCIQLQVDDSSVASGSFLGVAGIMVESLVRGQQMEVDLLEEDGQKTGRKLHLSGKWMPVQDEPPSAQDLLLGMRELALAEGRGGRPSRGAQSFWRPSLRGVPTPEVQRSDPTPSSSSTSPPSEAITQETRAAAEKACRTAAGILRSKNLRSFDAHCLSMGPAGAGFAQALVSARIDEVHGLPPDHHHKYFVRAIVSCPTTLGRTKAAGTSDDSTLGEPIAVVSDNFSDQEMVRISQELQGVPPDKVATVLGISPEFAEEFAKHKESDSGLAEWQQDWCLRARTQARNLAASSRPQFHTIFHLPTGVVSHLELQLVRRKEPSNAEEIVAVYENDLAKLAEAGGTLKGPFKLDLRDGDGQCTLEGSVRIRRLLVPRDQERETSELTSGDIVDAAR